MKTEDLLEIARWSVKRARKIIPFSSNLPDRDRQTLHRKLLLALVRHKTWDPELKLLAKEIISWNLDLTSEKERREFMTDEFWVESLNSFLSLHELYGIVRSFETTYYEDFEGMASYEINALNAAELGAGNCGELADYVFGICKEYPTTGLPGLPAVTEEIPLERVNIPGDENHGFGIMDRDQDNTSIQNVLGWDDRVIFQDAWTHEVYTKKELFENKSPEEKAYIINLFKKANVVHRGFLSADYNTEIHSEAWRIAHMSNSQLVPEKLLDLKDFNKKPEQLPKKRKQRTPDTIHFINQYIRFIESLGFFYEYLNQDNINISKLRHLFEISLKEKTKLEKISTTLLKNGELNKGRKLLLAPYLIHSDQTVKLDTGDWVKENEWRKFFSIYDDCLYLLKNYIQAGKVLNWELQQGEFDFEQPTSYFNIFLQMHIVLQNYFFLLGVMQFNLADKEFISSLNENDKDRLELQKLIQAYNLHFKIKTDLFNYQKKLQTLKQDFIFYENDLVNQYANYKGVNPAFALLQNKCLIVSEIHHQLNVDIEEYHKMITSFSSFKVKGRQFTLSSIPENAIFYQKRLIENQKILENLAVFERWIKLFLQWPTKKKDIFSSGNYAVWFAANKDIFNLASFTKLQEWLSLSTQDGAIYRNFLNKYLLNAEMDKRVFQENLQDFSGLFLLYWQKRNSMDEKSHHISSPLKKYIESRRSINHSTLWHWIVYDPNLVKEKIILANECLFVVERTNDLTQLNHVIDDFLARNDTLEKSFKKNSHSWQKINFRDTLLSMRDLLQSPSFRLAANDKR